MERALPAGPAPLLLRGGTVLTLDERATATGHAAVVIDLVPREGKASVLVVAGPTVADRAVRTRAGGQVVVDDVGVLRRGLDVAVIEGALDQL